MGIGAKKMNDISLEEKLENKIMKLSQTIWENKINQTNLQEWLENFQSHKETKKCERTQALFLLSNFMYFGVREVRELLRSVYRDKFYNPLVQEIRKSCEGTKNFDDIKPRLIKELDSTRFLGVGNPSESGTHLLYFFRQENSLSKESFMHVHDIFDFNKRGEREVTVQIQHPDIKRYIFIDDVCGSGNQAVEYSQRIVDKIKELDPEIKVHYYTLFATGDGLKKVKERTSFDVVDSIFTLDSTFKCFSETSRYFDSNLGHSFCKKSTKLTCEKYGKYFNYPEQHLLGYENGQLLLGFYHNTPDNTLPIFWMSEKWTPIFKRYSKLYQTNF